MGAMMDYYVTQDVTVEGKELLMGATVKDGDFEPDVMAQLTSSGILTMDAPAEAEPEKAVTKHKSK
jgi:hypothetical protein